METTDPYAPPELMDDPVESPHDWYIVGPNILVRNHAALPEVNLDTDDDDAELIEAPMRILGPMPFWAYISNFGYLLMFAAPKIGLGMFEIISLASIFFY